MLCFFFLQFVRQQARVPFRLPSFYKLFFFAYNIPHNAISLPTVSITGLNKKNSQVMRPDYFASLTINHHIVS